MPAATSATSDVAKTVTVALKMPHGLILRLFRMEDHDEQVMGGGTKTVQKAVLDDRESVRLNGTSKKWDQPYAIDAHGNPVLLMGGYALTSGVDAQFFDEWMRQNAKSDLVRNNLIFAAGRTNETRDMAKEFASTRSGLEPLSPGDRNDKRVPGRIAPAGTAAAA